MILFCYLNQIKKNSDLLRYLIVFLSYLRNLLKTKLERFVELDFLLPGHQYGFRKGRSCDDCITLLLLEIYKGFINHDLVGVLLLDIKGAYDK